MVGTKHFTAPPFGGEYADQPTVYAFYEFWNGFGTIKQFAYVDLFNPNDCPNRRVKRMVEEDNKKERRKERVKFNDVIRDLIKHVKKLDVRMQRYMTLEAEERERRRKERQDAEEAFKAKEREELVR